MAGIAAFETALTIKKTTATDFNKLVLKADSKYLVKGVTDWIFKWEKNGYVNTKGTPVTNAGLFKRLKSLVWELAESEVEVLFWHVPRAQNQESGALANMAFNRS